MLGVAFSAHAWEGVAPRWSATLVAGRFQLTVLGGILAVTHLLLSMVVLRPGYFLP